VSHEQRSQHCFRRRLRGRGDNDIRVFKTRESAVAWRADIVASNWNSARLGAQPQSPKEASAMYFEDQSSFSETWFSIEERKLE
jgi:hypothetical protein